MPKPLREITKLSHDEFVGKGKTSWNVHYDHGKHKGKNRIVLSDTEDGARAAMKKKGIKIHSVKKLSDK
jgi:hypothetical protein